MVFPRSNCERRVFPQPPFALLSVLKGLTTSLPMSRALWIKFKKRWRNPAHSFQPKAAGTFIVTGALPRANGVSASF
jgi:hypothetical protein